MRDRCERIWIDRFPLFVFFSIYLPSCYLGVILYLLGIASPASLPALTPRDVAVILALLHLAPALLWTGFALAFSRIEGLWLRREAPLVRPIGSPALGGFLLVVAAALGIWSLARGGALERIADLSGQGTYLAARWELMKRLRFFEFVNLYTVLPIAGAYVVLASRRRWLAGAAVAAVIALVQYPLAQRRVLVTSALLIGFAIYVHWLTGPPDARRRPNVQRSVAALFAGGVAIYALFLALTLQWGAPRLATTALLWRYAIPAIVYSAAFPKHLPYYPLDLGLDVLGIGAMPDDNVLVQRWLRPESAGMTISAPFPFVLYSQGGVAVALVGSAIVGAALGAMWAAVLSARRASVARSLCGALVLTLAAFLAMDSVRNSAIASYGVVWGLLVVGALDLADRPLARLQRPAN